MITTLLRAALVILLTAVHFDVATATTIIVARTPESVTIASDSKRVLDNGQRQETTVCKIHQTGNVLIARAGVSVLGKNNVDLTEYAKQAASASRSLSEIVAEFDRIIDVHLDQMTNTLLLSEPTFAKRLYTWFVQVAFVGLEGDQPAMIVRKYMPYTAGGKLLRRINRYSCPGDDCPDGLGGILLGEFMTIKPILGKDQSLLTENTVANARRLIEMEIKANPTKVGAPIEIVRFGKEGIEWVQDELHCGTTTKKTKNQRPR